MKSLFRWCHEEGHLTINPAAKFKEPKACKRIQSFYKKRRLSFYVKPASALWKRPYFDSRQDKEPAISVTERQPYRMSIAQMRYYIKKISARAGINKEIHPHQLRHGYATHLLNNGAPVEVIQSLLGHEKSENTRIYAQLSRRPRQEFYQKYF